jgi:hypothetical protein
MRLGRDRSSRDIQAGLVVEVGQEYKLVFPGSG